MQKLKPGTSYDFNADDLKFVVELAKVGHVHLLSNQVSLITTREYDENALMEFKDIMSEEKCDGLRLPHNWFIEWIGAGKKGLSITFGVKEVITILLIAFLAACGPSRYIPCPGSATKVIGDTVPEWMHISTRPKGFVFAQVALAVRQNGCCVAHLQCDGRPFPVHFKVGWCEGKEALFNRLVSQLK